MDKKLILSVAGSGKTKFIIDKLCLEKRSLIITYTDNNIKNLTQRVRDKFGYVPENIKIFSYFTFLYSFCFRPLLNYKYDTKGIFFTTSVKNFKDYRFSKSNRLTQDDAEYYYNKNKQLYDNTLSLLIEKEAMQDVCLRISKYFDNVFIDEVQDFGGYDFSFLLALHRTNSNIYLVGDFYQHTFETSNAGRKNKTLYDCYETYKKQFKNKFEPDDTTLIKSHRCNPTVCKFVSEKLGINIESARSDETEIKFIDCPKQLLDILNDSNIIKLFYEDSIKQKCEAENWAKSKGLDCFQDVCIILTGDTTELWNKEQNFLNLESSKTRNKLYVACTRAKGNLYFIHDTFYKRYSDSSQLFLL